MTLGGVGYLKQISYSEVHHEHHSPLGFSYVDPEHPQCQNIPKQSWCQDDAVHHCVDLVLILPQNIVIRTVVVVHLKDNK